MSTPTKLNLGSGTDIRPGYVNLDIAALPGVDVVHDLAILPLPFDDATFDEIVCKDILEHVDLVAVLRELWRIMRPGGRLHITSPHFTSVGFFIDPTHRTAFSIETFSFFAGDSRWSGRSYYFDFRFASVERARIIFHRYRFEPWNYLLEPLINRSLGLQRYYEATGLSRLFPAANVEVTLVR